jgi:hypothetical protein
MQTTIKLCGLTKDRMTITVATTPIQGLTIRMTNGEEMDEVSDTTDAIHGLCEKQFKLNGEQLCELMAMCIGLKSFDERTLGDAAVEPYASMKHRKKVNPTQKHMCEEIKRRSTAIGEDTPTCKYWTKEKLLLWLNDNPVSEPDDLLFLVSEEKKLFDVVNSSKKEATAVSETSSSRAAPWTTNEPYLRLYHAIFHEDVQPLLMSMNDVMDRSTLDARNSSARPETFFEAVARIFNDDIIFFSTDILPDLHYSFAHSLLLDFDDMPGPVTPEEVKKRFADARAKLIKIISKWELSGNGFGQRALGDDDFGHMSEENLEAGENRGNFLDSMTKEHILYFWYLADKNELMKNVLNVIADTSSADSENYQTTSKSSDTVVSNHRKRKSEARLANEFRVVMGDALSNMSVASMLEQLRSAEAQAMKYEELLITTDNERLKSLYKRYADKEEKRVLEIQSALDSVRKQRTMAVDSSFEDDDE